MNISVVIPTRNRPDNLNRCLVSLVSQTGPLREVIVIDASDDPVDHEMLAKKYPTLTLVVLTSASSVCVQRNMAIRVARGSHILLSDDDMEFPPDYVATLTVFMRHHDECGAATGLVLEPGPHGFRDVTLQPATAVHLCWKFLFQLTVWSDVEAIASDTWLPVQSLKSYYRRRGNTLSLAGWPLVTQVRGDSFRTSIFGLGAALVRREWLQSSMFDELLDPNGIGDHYGVAINFPGVMPVHVLRTTGVKHHRSGTNRPAETTAYYRRILALHYFMSRSTRFTVLNRAMLLWSLFGNFTSQVVHGDLHRAQATLKASILISGGNNPYLVAFRSGVTGPITPDL